MTHPLSLGENNSAFFFLNQEHPLNLDRIFSTKNLAEQADSGGSVERGQASRTQRNGGAQSQGCNNGRPHVQVIVPCRVNFNEIDLQKYNIIWIAILNANKQF